PHPDPLRADGAVDQRCHPGVTALLVWLLALPIAILLPAPVDESPLTLQGDALPVVAGDALVGAGLLAARRGHTSAGVVAGLFAAWMVLGMRTALHGSPFGFIDGDTVRLSAIAERYTTTWRSADGIVSAVPSEYPPLYPWLIGRGLADREQLAVGRVVGRLVSGDSAVAAQGADDDLGEALTDRGAAALAVEDPSDGRVVVAGGEPGEQRDRVLVGADR
ncbi:MAG: hypothetical protein ACRDNS_33225, partial [Trebonia sp.]